MAEKTNTECECGCPMAIGVLRRRVIWKCMSILCHGEHVTDSSVYAPDCEPRRYGIDESLKAMVATSRAGKSLVRGRRVGGEGGAR